MYRVHWILLVVSYVVYFFFFKQKTSYEMRISDWSSDVCSSDLVAVLRLLAGRIRHLAVRLHRRPRRQPEATAGRTARAAQRTALLARPADRRHLADGPGQPALRTCPAVGRGDPPAQPAAEPVRAAPGTPPQAVLAGRAPRRRRAQPADARDVCDHPRAAVPAVGSDDRAPPAGVRRSE